MQMCGIAMRILSVSVPLSVYPSITRVHCDKTEEMIGGGRPVVFEILSQSESVGAKFEQ